MNAPAKSVPMLTTWMGRDIRELSREELIVALEETVRAYHAALKHGAESLKLMRLFAVGQIKHG